MWRKSLVERTGIIFWNQEVTEATLKHENERHRRLYSRAMGLLPRMQEVLLPEVGNGIPGPEDASVEAAAI